MQGGHWTSNLTNGYNRIKNGRGGALHNIIDQRQIALTQNRSGVEGAIDAAVHWSEENYFSVSVWANVSNQLAYLALLYHGLYKMQNGLQAVVRIMVLLKKG